MRFIEIAAIIFALSFAATVPAAACPTGYVSCGGHYCCPR